jgi:hypothetical protein
MASNPIDESPVAKALRLRKVRKGIEKLLSLQGSGLWHGDLAEMRRDEQPLPADNNQDAASASEVRGKA